MKYKPYNTHILPQKTTLKGRQDLIYLCSTTRADLPETYRQHWWQTRLGEAQCQSIPHPCVGLPDRPLHLERARWAHLDPCACSPQGPILGVDMSGSNSLAIRLYDPYTMDESVLQKDQGFERLAPSLGRLGVLLPLPIFRTPPCQQTPKIKVVTVTPAPKVGI